MTEIRKMGARFWELYSGETLFFGGGILTAAAFAIFGVAGMLIAGYIWLVITNLATWEQEAAPFKWVKSDNLNWLLVLLGPLTTLVTIAWLFACIAGGPFLLWRDIQKRQKRELRQIEEDKEGGEYAKPTPLRLRNWLIGGAIYYACVAGAAVVILILFRVI